MDDPPVKPAGPAGRPRSYNSPKRAEAARATRRRIRAAAQMLFLRDGYAPTTMKAIAGQAGVAERTVFLAFPTKADLLAELIRVAVRGDDGDEPLSARSHWTAMLAAPTETLLGDLARLNADLMARTAHVLALGESAATADPVLAELRDRGRRATRAQMREVATELAARHALAPGVDVERATDTLHALVGDPTIYLRLVEECGWTPEAYAQLLETVLAAALTAS